MSNRHNVPCPNALYCDKLYAMYYWVGTIPGKPKLQSSCVFPRSILTLSPVQLFSRLLLVGFLLPATFIYITHHPIEYSSLPASSPQTIDRKVISTRSQGNGIHLTAHLIVQVDWSSHQAWKIVTLHFMILLARLYCRSLTCAWLQPAGCLLFPHLVAPPGRLLAWLRCNKAALGIEVPNCFPPIQAAGPESAIDSQPTNFHQVFRPLNSSL